MRLKLIRSPELNNFWLNAVQRGLEKNGLVSFKVQLQCKTKWKQFCEIKRTLIGFQQGGKK